VSHLELVVSAAGCQQCNFKIKKNHGTVLKLSVSHLELVVSVGVAKDVAQTRNVPAKLVYTSTEIIMLIAKYGNCNMLLFMIKSHEKYLTILIGTKKNAL
jgi:hypothetical protein